MNVIITICILIILIVIGLLLVFKCYNKEKFKLEGAGRKYELGCYFVTIVKDNVFETNFRYLIKRIMIEYGDRLFNSISNENIHYTLEIRFIHKHWSLQPRRNPENYIISLILYNSQTGTEQIISYELQQSYVNCDDNPVYHLKSTINPVIDGKPKFFNEIYVGHLRNIGRFESHKLTMIINDWFKICVPKEKKYNSEYNLYEYDVEDKSYDVIENEYKTFSILYDCSIKLGQPVIVYEDEDEKKERMFDTCQFYLEFDVIRIKDVLEFTITSHNIDKIIEKNKTDYIPENQVFWYEQGETELSYINESSIKKEIERRRKIREEQEEKEERKRRIRKEQEEKEERKRKEEDRERERIKEEEKEIKEEKEEKLEVLEERLNLLDEEFCKIMEEYQEATEEEEKKILDDRIDSIVKERDIIEKQYLKQKEEEKEEKEIKKENSQNLFNQFRFSTNDYNIQPSSRQPSIPIQTFIQQPLLQQSSTPIQTSLSQPQLEQPITFAQTSLSQPRTTKTPIQQSSRKQSKPIIKSTTVKKHTNGYNQHNQPYGQQQQSYLQRVAVPTDMKNLRRPKEQQGKK